MYKNLQSIKVSMLIRCLALVFVVVASSSLYAAELQGSVALPATSASNANDIEVNVVLCPSYYPNDEGCSTADVVILAGANSANFNLTYDEALGIPEYTVTARCVTNCDLYVTQNIYLRNDLSSSLNFSTVMTSNLSQSGTLTLVEKDLLTGVLSLPNSAIADGAITTTITVCTYNVSFGLIGCADDVVSVADGSSSVPYSISTIPRPSNGGYRVFTECIDNCSPYLSSAFYLRSDFVTTSRTSWFIGSDLPDSIDFELTEGQTLSGTISLPIGAVATNDIVNQVNLCSYSNGSGWCSRVEVTIASGTSSIDYTVVTQFTLPGGTYRFSSSCLEGCGPYVRDLQYLQSDLSLSFEPDYVGVAIIPATIDVSLIAGQVLNGSISLPNSDVAVIDIPNQVWMCSYSSDGNQISCDSEDVLILDGSNSADYSLVIRPASDGGYYRVGTRCEYQCGIFLNDTRYLQSDLTVGFESADIAISSLPINFGFILDKGKALSGVVSLPNSELANADIDNSFEFCSFTALGNPIDCRYQYGGAIISDGTNSTPYAISVRPAPAGGYYRFSSSCSNCGVYLTDTQYLQTDHSFAYASPLVPADTFPSSIDISLVEGQLVTGTVSLPNGNLAEFNTNINLRLCSYNSEGLNISCSPNYDYATIQSGTNSIAYVLSVRPATADGSYRLTSRCSSNCDLYLSNYQYLQADLSTGFEPSYVLASMFPATVDFTLSEGTVLTGSISLPDSELAEENIQNAMNICSYDSNATQLACSTNYYLQIASGQNAQDYAISVLPAPANGFYRVSTSCVSNCELFLSNNQYLQADLSIDFTQQNIPASSLPASANFILSRGKLISGLLKLPNNESAINSISNRVELCSYDANTVQLACSGNGGTPTIASGANSGIYSVSVRPAPAGGFYRLSTNCYAECGLYLWNRQYLQADLSFEFTEDYIAAATTPEVVDFTLSTGQLLTGTVSLPNDELAQHEVPTSVQICAYTSSGGYLGCQSTYQTIAVGQNEIPYAVSVLPATSGGYYSVSSACTYNCGLFLSDTLFLQADLSIGFNQANVDKLLLPPSVDFVLPRGQELIGNINLPNGLLAENEIYSDVSICAYDANGQYLRCEEQQFTILDGTNGIPFGVSLRPAPIDGFYRISTRCSSNCGLFLTQTRYLQADLSIDYETALIPASSVPTSADFTLDQGKILQLQLGLPNGSLATQPINNGFEFCSLNNLGATIDCSSSYNISISESSSSVSAFASVRPAPADGFYRFWTSCRSNCGLYLDDRQYLQADLTGGFGLALIPAAGFPDSIAMTLMLGKTLTIQLSLPDNEVAVANIRNVVAACSLDNQGSSIDCASTYGDPTIAAGASSAAYSLALRPAPVDGSYQVSTRCYSGCALYLQDTQYLQADLTTGYDYAVVSALIVPDTISFTLPKGKVLTGKVSLPEGELATNLIYNSLTFCSFRANNQQVDCGYVNPRIDAGANTAEYSLSIKAAPSDGYYSLSNSCGYSCGIYRDEILYLQEDLSIGFGVATVSAAVMPEIADFTLSKGQVVNGKVQLPDSLLANEPIGSDVKLCVYSAQGQSLDCGRDYITIVNGANSASFEVSTRPAPVGGYYRLSFECSSNCGSYLDVSQYLTQISNVSYEPANLFEEDIPGNVTFVLPRGLDLTGSIILPNSEVASVNISSQVSLCSYDSDNQELDCTQIVETIMTGASSQPYSVSVRPAPTNGFYRLSTRCQSGCSDYLSNLRYLQADLSLDFAISTIPQSGLTETVDLVLTKGLLISGSLVLPDDETAAADIRNSITLCSFDEHDAIIECQSSNLTIASGLQSAQYSLSIRPAPLGGSYRLSTYCWASCDPYLDQAQYLQADLTSGVDEALIDAAVFPAEFNFELTKGYIVAGLIKLPNDELANEGYNNNVRICSYDAGMNFLDCNSDNIVISSGGNSKEYTLSIQPAPPGGYYEVSSACYSCAGFLSNTQYLQADLSYGFTPAKIAAADLQQSINFTLDRGLELTVSLQLPNNQLASTTIYNSVNVCTYTSTGSQQNCSYNGSVQINSGATATSISLAILPAPSDGYYQVNTNCTSSCGSYLTNRQYLQSDLTIGEVEANVPANLLPNEVTFTLPQGVSLSGYVRLPGSIPAGDNIRNTVTLCSYTSSDVVIACRNDYPYIYTGQLGAEYSIDAVRPAPDDGYYRISTNCGFDCGSYLTETQYLQADLSIGFAVANISPTLIPDTVNFTLFLLSPDIYENDDSWDTATDIAGAVTQSHNIHNPGDEDWLKLTLSEPGNFHVSARANVNELGVSIELFSDDLTVLSISPPAEISSNQYLSSLDMLSLSAGIYYLKFSAEFTSETIDGYQFDLQRQVEEEIEDLCIPIRAKNGNVSLICL